MKKLFVYLLTMALLLGCLSSCDLFEKDRSVTYEEYENCAVFTFDGFSNGEGVSFDLARTSLGEGAIHYHVNLVEGALSIKYTDDGLINADNEYTLGEFTADMEMSVNGSGGCVSGDKITVTFESSSRVKGEIIIAFTEDALIAVRRSLKLHEHEYYYEKKEDAHKKIYTCDCEWLKERDFEPHFDEDKNGECDECEYKIEPVYALLGEYEDWLLELEAEDVAEVKTFFQYVGVAPGSLKRISSTSDKDDIVDIIQKYAYAKMTEITQEDTYIDGGSEFTIEFIFTDGTKKAFSFNNSNYVDHPAEYYRLVSIPKLDGYENTSTYYGFVTYYEDRGEAYTNGQFLGEISVERLKFVEFTEAVDFYPEEYCYILTDFGTLSFFSSSVFYINYSATGREGYYKLVGTTVDEVIAECLKSDME